jgi:hypothetical protein
VEIGKRFTNLHLKSDESLDDILPFGESDMAWWYRNNKTYCYKKVLPFHDKTVSVGTLQFSGNFVDSNALPL